MRDRARFEPRVAMAAPIVRWMVRVVFFIRHRNLRRIFGELGAG